MPESNSRDRIRIADRVTIFPRGKKGTWIAEFSQDGRHRKVSLKTRNLKLARQMAVKLENDLIEGTFRSPGAGVTIRSAIDTYLEFCRTEGRAPATIEAYRRPLDEFVSQMEKAGVRLLGKVAPTDFDRFRAACKEGRGARTLHLYGTVVKQLFRFALSRRLITENPLAGCRLARPKYRKRSSPSLLQVELLLAAAPEPLRTRLALLAFTGLRSGEMRHLRPEDVDLSGNWIHVVSRPGAETKTRESRRVPIAARLRPMLAALPKTERPWLFTAAPGRRYPDGGRPIDIHELNRALKRLLRRLRLPCGRVDGGFTIHSLRHFFETFCVNSRIPQRVVDVWMGHKIEHTTSGLYYDLSDEESQRFMRELTFAGAPAADAGSHATGAGGGAS